ncbi:MAG: DNA repair protein RadC [Candidatus Nanohaloarchaea archaeon]|nr:DNA repair protein RadC [Candidatus Nanohaloarchaea archaeon]
MPDYTVKELPRSERPRERLQEQGAESLTDAELLALVIRSGSEGRNVLELARGILAEFTLDGLADASVNELEAFEGVGPVKAGQVKALGELCRRTSTDRAPKKGTVRSFEDAVPHLAPMEQFTEECIGMLCLDSGNTVIATELDLMTGAVDRVSVEPRVVVREAVRQRASGVILAHNHPSGDPEPSEEDVQVTETVKEALDTVGIELLDHIVVGRECRSLKKEGYL